MKVIQCEMCGSRDLLKQDGVFVCQACGTKYSVEEAKKMMVEGTVQVAGTVKVDKSEELKNLYILAERARKSNNSDNAVRYYNQIIEKDPNSWQANFYLIYFKAKNTNVGSIPGVCYDLVNCYQSTFELLKEEKGEDITKDLKKLIDDIYAYSEIIVSSTRGMQEDCKYLGHAVEILARFGDTLVETYGEAYEEVAVTAWRKAMDIFMDAKPSYVDASNYNDPWIYLVSRVYSIEELQSKINSHGKKLIRNKKNQKQCKIECSEEFKKKIKNFVRMTQQAPKEDCTLTICNEEGNPLIYLTQDNNELSISLENRGNILTQSKVQDILPNVINEHKEIWVAEIDKDADNVLHTILHILDDIYQIDNSTVRIEIDKSNNNNNNEEMGFWSFLGLFICSILGLVGIVLICIFASDGFNELMEAWWVIPMTLISILIDTWIIKKIFLG